MQDGGVLPQIVPAFILCLRDNLPEFVSECLDASQGPETPQLQKISTCHSASLCHTPITMT
jgi:hypothetical protein